MKKIVLMALAVSLWTAGYAKVNVAESENTAPAGVEAVDLGLSVKWANMNLGASKSSDYGTYYAWGETKPKKYYSWDTYAWSKGNAQYLIKYSPSDGKTQLEASDDAARANWGDDWRMPTAKEFEELVNPDNCTWEWITKDGVNGYKAYHGLPLLCGHSVPSCLWLLLDIDTLSDESEQGLVSGV